MNEIFRPLIRSCVILLLTLPLGSGVIAASAGQISLSSDISRSPSASPYLLITGVYFDPFTTGEASEAVQVQNTTDSAISISGWSLADDHAKVSFPEGATLTARQKVWASKSASAFHTEFGLAADFEYGGDSDPAVPDMAGEPLDLGNEGDLVILADDSGRTIDLIPYGDTAVTNPAWNGEAVQPYSVAGETTEGHILYRKMRESEGLPVDDTNSAADWAQDPKDSYLGKRALLPGWDLDRFLETAKTTEYAHVKYCVAPDNMFDCYRDEILAAQTSILIEVYSLNNARLVDSLTKRITAGVTVQVLVDADAIDDQGRWACQEIESHGGQCWLEDAKPQSKIARRYENLHGKWMLIDGKRLIEGSENLGDDGMPSDDKRDGTKGTRGGSLATDSPAMVARADEIMYADLDPSNHQDIRRWGTSANDYPPLGFVPNYSNGGTSYRVQFPTPFLGEGTFSFELVQCPENCLRQSDGLLGLISKSRTGDTLLVEQLYERKFWGDASSNPTVDPNLVLEALVRAAQRGAQVQLLLDSLFDTFSDPRSNYETCRYINGWSPYYHIECRLGNPTGLGLHNKMVLLKQGSTGYVHLGSINGSETSVKLNRELAVQVESSAAYTYWSKVFNYDWSDSNLSPHQVNLPILFRR